MKTLEIYRNYGVLGAEKRNVFTYGGEHPTADCSDTLTVAVPDDWDLHETANGRYRSVGMGIRYKRSFTG